MKVFNIQPLVEIVGNLGTYSAWCRDCGLLPPVVDEEQTIVQAALVRNRHLAEHVQALADELAEAVR
jgi:hypothetical protein